MDVAVSALRSDLSRWIDRVRDGEEIVVTDRGIPVARMVPVDSAPLLERLVREGVLSRPKTRNRPTASTMPKVEARGSVSEFISEQRR